MKIRLPGGVSFEVQPALRLEKKSNAGMVFAYIPGAWALPGMRIATSTQINAWAAMVGAEVIW